MQGIQILVRNPLVGRPVKRGKLELVIGEGSRGYVALNRFVASIATVFAVGSQRESSQKTRATLLRRTTPRDTSR